MSTSNSTIKCKITTKKSTSIVPRSAGWPPEDNLKRWTLKRLLFTKIVYSYSIPYQSFSPALASKIGLAKCANFLM